jgi:hypothetical protein
VKAGKAQKRLAFAGLILIWIVVLRPLWIETRLFDTLQDATDSLKGGNSWFVLALVIIPMMYAAYKFAQSEYEVAAHVPRPLRPLCHFWFLSVRAFALMGAVFPIAYLTELVPMWAQFAAMGVFMSYLLAMLIRQAIRVSAAEKTVTTLYESIKIGNSSVRTELCEPEALEGFDALESQFGELTWYQVTRLIEEDNQFRYVVQSIRNKAPKFEEVTIGPNGKRVLHVT